MKAMQKVWAKRQLFIYFLQPYSPHRNIIERIWKELKTRGISLNDYENEQQLFYSIKLILYEIGVTC